MIPKILIAFYSRSGTIEALAKAMGEGAKQEGAELRLRRAREVVPQNIMEHVPGWAEAAAAMNERYESPNEDDARWADAIIFGTPTRFGGACSELRAYIDGLGGLWMTGALNGKLGSAFSSTASAHGGNETTILSLYPTMAHLGLVIVPTGYSDPSLFLAGTPYGSSAISPVQNPASPTPQDLDVARYQGKRVAKLAKALVADC